MNVASLSSPRAVAIGSSIALSVLMLLAALLGHLAGGYDVWYWTPAAIGMSVALAFTLAIVAPVRSRFRGRIRLVGLGALAAFVAWTALAWTWSDNQHVAHEELTRTAWFAGAVLAGLVFSRSRSAVKTALAAWVLGTSAATLVLLRGLGGEQDTMFADGRLLGRLEYHNGQAAFLLVPLCAAIALAAMRSTHPVLRAVLAGCACVLLAAAVLPQSRGGLVALVFALLVYFAASPVRARSLLVLAVPVTTTALLWERLNRVYTTTRAEEDARAAINAVIDGILVAAAAAMVVVALIAFFDRRREPSIYEARVGKAVVGAGALIALVVLIASVPALRSPIDAVQTQWDHAVNPPEQQVTSEEFGRFAILGNQSTAARVVLWKAAIEAAKQEPVTGVGPGNYDRVFYAEREQVLDRYVKQPHNITLEMFAERGIVGGTLFVVFLLTCVATAIRVRVSDASTETKALIASILGCVAYWLAHAQFDWLWQLSATTLGVMVLLGMLLGAPWRYEDERRVGQPVRFALVAVCLVAAALPIPLLVADRYVHRAEHDVLEDPDRALRSLDVAERWAPWSPTVQQLRAEAHESTLDYEAGDQAIAAQIELNERHWATHMIAASWYERSGRKDEARLFYEQAAKLNPLEPDLEDYR